jgi:DNA-binding NtrC family response regulator
VVVITAETDAELKRQALAQGAQAVLAKPVVFSDLLAALDIEATASAPATRAAEGMAATGARPVAHVMVVDDDAGVREALVEFLELQRFRVSQAADAAGALLVIGEAAPDVVLLDIEMPGLSGTDALPAIRALAPRAAVIMVSGTTDEDVAKRALARGAFDYVVKPIQFGYLARTLETALTMRLLQPE